MKHQRNFPSINASQEAARTESLIADLDRIVQILNSDIAEQQVKAADRSRSALPSLAKALVARRDNLIGTITALQQRLDAIKQPSCSRNQLRPG
jgi:hypothetical protein